MVNAVNKKGGSAKLTLINGAKHNAWDTAFGTRETFADISATILEALGADKGSTAGQSFLSACMKEEA